MSGTPVRVRLYVVFLAIAAITTVTVVMFTDKQFLWSAALGFGILCFLAENFSLTMTIGTTYSVSFVLVIAATIAAGPGEAVVATLLGTVSLWEARSKPPIRHLFNASQLAICAGLGGLAYVWAGGPVGDGGHAIFPAALVPLIVCTMINFLANSLLVSGVVSLSERRPMWQIWKGQYVSLGGTYVAFALLGLLLGTLYLQMGWASVLFLLMPLLVARHAFQAAINLQTAYDDTVRSLITAIEAKDPYTRGHAERVSRLAEMTARAYKLSEERCKAIRYAALMHDVGKLGVLSSVLQKPGKLTPEEYEHMKVHPVHGVAIVSEIDLLEEAIVGVRHHHERMDGKGYPDGLVGEQIPLFARIIMVSDAFDSMTSTRVYRKAKAIEEAFVELRRCEGTQFDPKALEALEKAIQRYGWEPAPENEEDEEAAQEAALRHLREHQLEDEMANEVASARAAAL